MARLRSSQRVPAPTIISSDRGVLKEKTKNTKQRPALPRVAASRDSDELVKDAPTQNPRKRVLAAQDEGDVYMAGASEDGAGGEPLLNRCAQPTQANGPVTSQTRPTKKPPRMTRKPVRSAARTQILDGLMKRIEETARQEATKPAEPPKQPVKSAKPAEDTTAVSQLSDVTVTPSPPRIGHARNSMLSVQMPGSALRSHATPGADTSTFALKHFRQRPRQGSMLQIVQQKIASARPSAVHIPSDDDEDMSTTFALGAASDEEDDFRPDAEGTPMRKQLNPPLFGTSSRKRKSDGDSNASALGRLMAKRSKPSPPPSPKRQQASPAHTHGRRTNSPAVLSDASRRSSPRLRVPQSVVPSQNDFALAIDEANHLDSVVPSTERQEEQPNARHNLRSQPPPPADGAMAEPASSSPLRSPAGFVKDLGLVTAGPMTQLSPPPPTKRTKAKKAAPISTAHLQTLLPKRRERNGRLRQTAKKSIYEISSNEETSDEEEDIGSEDELGPRRPIQNRANKKQSTKQSRPRQNKTSRKTPAPARRKTAAKSAKKGVITYGKQTTSDKENEEYESTEEQDDTTVQEVSMYEASKSKELEELKRKFADIDDMELEFESMSGDENHRSSQSWR